jgi:hypothetical protein
MDRYREMSKQSKGREKESGISACVWVYERAYLLEPWVAHVEEGFIEGIMNVVRQCTSTSSSCRY